MNIEQQFANFDAPLWPQAVRIDWRRLELDDETGNPGDYLFQDDEYRAQDQTRLDAWRAGDWSFIGIQAEATIYVPIGQGCFSTYTLTSPGLWGIESDSGEECFAEVFEEEKAQLIDALKLIGKAAETL